MMSRKISDERRKRILKEYESGEKNKSYIARKYDVSASFVSKLTVVSKKWCIILKKEVKYGKDIDNY